MKKNPLIILLLLIIGIAIVLAMRFGNSDSSKSDISSQEEIPFSNQRPEISNNFSWYFEEADVYNLDGFKKTDLYLEIVYIDDTTRKQYIDTVDGGCSELIGETHEGDISTTGKIQCYYAGFGQHYRIIQQEEDYFVERRFFEEIIPEQIPVDYEWEIIAEVF